MSDAQTQLLRKQYAAGDRSLGPVLAFQVYRSAGWTPGQDRDGPKRQEIMRLVAAMKPEERKPLMRAMALFCRSPLEHEWEFVGDKITVPVSHACKNCCAAGRCSVDDGEVVEISG